jgi:hypothetical protein
MGENAVVPVAPLHPERVAADLRQLVDAKGVVASHVAPIDKEEVRGKLRPLGRLIRSFD